MAVLVDASWLLLQLATARAGRTTSVNRSNDGHQGSAPRPAVVRATWRCASMPLGFCDTSPPREPIERPASTAATTSSRPGAVPSPSGAPLGGARRCHLDSVTPPNRESRSNDQRLPQQPRPPGLGAVPSPSCAPLGGARRCQLDPVTSPNHASRSNDQRQPQQPRAPGRGAVPSPSCAPLGGARQCQSDSVTPPHHASRSNDQRLPQQPRAPRLSALHSPRRRATWRCASMPIGFCDISEPREPIDHRHQPQQPRAPSPPPYPAEKTRHLALRVNAN